MDMQDLFALARLFGGDKARSQRQRHFTVSVRTTGPWVCLAETTDFAEFVAKYSAIRVMLATTTGISILTEILMPDPDVDTVYNSTILESVEL